MKISFAMITRHFNSLEPIEEFLDNAHKYGHKIYSVIIVYSHSCDVKLVEILRKKVKVFAVQINNVHKVREQLRQMGMHHEDIDILLDYPDFRKNMKVPYGFNRNYALIKAMLTGSEVLVFIDTDVYPKVLARRDGEVKEEEIDFIGRHLEYLKQKEVIITTSDYSGYYIIPPMQFAGMKELFIGLQKEDAYKFLVKSQVHKCLNADNGKNRKVFETDKILGGNVAIKLDAFDDLPPFFSTIYNVRGEAVLTRGEDTLLGIKLKEMKKKCIDIDTKIFHNTFGNYPTIPDIKNNNSIKDRFYYTCLGWVGRNPFLNWLKEEDIDKIKGKQKKNITIGSIAIASFLDDNRFLFLPEALEISYNNLDSAIEEYKKTLKSWKEFMNKIRKGEN